jgi:hypothetical protein
MASFGQEKARGIQDKYRINAGSIHEKPRQSRGSPASVRPYLSHTFALPRETVSALGGEGQVEPAVSLLSGPENGRLRYSAGTG